MKKTIITLVCIFIAASMGYAQFPDGMVVQPTQVIGKRINSVGEVSEELVSSFSYSEDGKPYRYDFPGFSLWTTYSFEGDYLENEYTMHEGGHPVFGESLNYSYEEGRVKTISHIWNQMNSNEYWQYDYYEDGHLKQKDYKEGEGEYHQHYIYDYENEGRTKIESFWTSWSTQGILLRKKTTFQYDEEFRLISALSENYSIEGELTGSNLTTYSYTQSNMEESEIIQTLIDGIWTNTSIQRYCYDDFDRLVEQQNGSWQQEKGDWDITRKITFDTSEDSQTYTVSFYKKSGEEWVWDTFNDQTVLFEPYLMIQQRSLRYYMYEDMFGAGRINQFVFTFEAMNEPIYMSEEENRLSDICFYPNPGSDNLKVNTPIENAVIRFYNLQGQLMLARLFNFNTEISAEGWPSGIYLWEIWRDNHKEANGKWIKK